jgi:hypothetical protein
MMALLDYALNVANWTPPAQWYVAYFNGGTELTGGAYARQPVTWSEAVALSATHVRSGSATAVFFENLPAGDVDELRIMDAATGGNAGFVIPHVRTFVAGDDKGYAPDKIGVNASRTA